MLDNTRIEYYVCFICFKTLYVLTISFRDSLSMSNLTRCHHTDVRGKNKGKQCSDVISPYYSNYGNYCYKHKNDYYKIIRQTKKEQNKALLKTVETEKKTVKKRKYDMSNGDPGCQQGFLNSLKCPWQREDSNLSTPEIVDNFLHNIHQSIRESNPHLFMYPCDMGSVSTDSIIEELQGRGFTDVNLVSSGCIHFCILRRGITQKNADLQRGMILVILDDEQDKEMLRSVFDKPKL